MAGLLDVLLLITLFIVALFALLLFLAWLEPPHDQRVATFGSDQQSPAVPQPVAAMRARP